MRQVHAFGPFQIHVRDFLDRSQDDAGFLQDIEGQLDPSVYGPPGGPEEPLTLIAFRRGSLVRLLLIAQKSIPGSRVPRPVSVGARKK